MSAFGYKRTLFEVRNYVKNRMTGCNCARLVTLFRKPFRLGRFGLEKLGQIDRTVGNLERALSAIVSDTNLR